MKRIYLLVKFKARILVVAIALSVLVIYLISAHSVLFLSYVKVTIWPLVVFLFIYTFRPELKSALPNLTSIDTLLGSLKFNQNQERVITEETSHSVTAQANISFTATAEATVTSLEVPALSETTQAEDLHISEPIGEDLNSNPTREAIENYMKVSAQWGYTMALIGFKSPPIPLIKWVDGTPQIQSGSGSIIEAELENQVLTIKEQTERDTLIREILGIRKEINGLGPYDKISMGIGPSKLNMLKYQLNDLKKMLRTIDPSSIFLTDNES